MRKINYLMALLVVILLGACQSSTSNQNDNLLYNAKEWRAVTDELGSSFFPENIKIENELLEVDFTLKKKEEGEIVFIELVCDMGHSLKGKEGLTLKYKCETPLVVKLSQKDFGKYGDESYAHYQFVVPASENISEVDLNFSEFCQPGWTPDYSKGIPLKLENVDAIYLTPDVDSATGGSSKLGVESLVLK